MARGVDIPEVHWVIQYDPPSSATSFVHRCGRTARIGKTGNALVMLMPNEDAYVNFILRNQKVLFNIFHLFHFGDVIFFIYHNFTGFAKGITTHKI